MISEKYASLQLFSLIKKDMGLCLILILALKG